MNFPGINLTVPHKVAVLQYLDEVSPTHAMGAVNTVRREGNRLIGENTDGKGFLRALTVMGVDPVGTDSSSLAPAAPRAMTVELALAGARELIVVNRSPERGRPLVDPTGHAGACHVCAVGSDIRRSGRDRRGKHHLHWPVPRPEYAARCG